MVLGVSQNYPSISSSLGIIQKLNFIDFGTQILLANEVHRAPLNISVEECSNKISTNFTRELSSKFIVS